MYLVLPTITILTYNANNDVLIGQRAYHEGKLFQGYWDLPGGKIELGETPLQTVTRELFEETGLKLETARLIDVYHYTGLNVEGCPGLNLLYLVEHSGELKNIDDLENLTWISRAEALNKNLTPWTNYFLNGLNN